MLKIIMVFVLTLGLAACKSPVNNSSKIQLASEPIVTVDSASTQDNKLVITYASGRDDSENILKIIEDYNKQSEKYMVVYQELPYDYVERYNDIYNALKSKDISFDVIELNYTWIPELANKGYIESLESYTKKNNLDKSKYLESAFNATIYDDQIWGLPYNISAGFLFVRTDLIENVPKTWDELIQTSKAVEESGSVKYSYIMPGNRSQTILLEALEFIYSYGGRFFDQNGNLDFNREGIINGLNKMAEIYFSDYVPEDISKITNQEARNKFINGETALLRSDINTWTYANIQDSQVYNKFSVAPLPRGDKSVSTVLDGYANSINSNSKNKDAAYDFIEYLSGAEVQRSLAINSEKIPVLLETFKDKQVLEKNPYFATDKFINTIDQALSRAKTIHYRQFIDIFIEELDLFFYNKKTAEEVVNSMETKLNYVFENKL